ncbi:hypothetical protein TYRP_022938 [Tyrophagus putrescentiae]|nr:hypothetical protein TYRP_022938 [Tyrophagus putrescentiae]
MQGRFEGYTVKGADADERSVVAVHPFVHVHDLDLQAEYVDVFITANQLLLYSGQPPYAAAIHCFHQHRQVEHRPKDEPHLHDDNAQRHHQAEALQLAKLQQSVEEVDVGGQLTGEDAPGGPVLQLSTGEDLVEHQRGVLFDELGNLPHTGKTTMQ